MFSNSFSKIDAHIIIVGMMTVRDDLVLDYEKTTSLGDGAEESLL